MPRRTVHGIKGRIALLHSLAHIELNAIDMTWDLLGRFGHEPMPRSFFDDWVEVGRQEAEHFELISVRLSELGSSYGDLPAHDGLWQAAQATGHSLIARVAIVPLILITPPEDEPVPIASPPVEVGAFDEEVEEIGGRRGEGEVRGW